MGRQVDRHAGDRGREVGAVVEVEAAQEVLVGLAVAGVLGDQQAGHPFEDVGRAQRRSSLDAGGVDRAGGGGVGDAHDIGRRGDDFDVAQRRGRGRGLRGGGAGGDQRDGDRDQVGSEHRVRPGACCGRMLAKVRAKVWADADHRSESSGALRGLGATGGRHSRGWDSTRRGVSKVASGRGAHGSRGGRSGGTMRGRRWSGRRGPGRDAQARGGRSRRSGGRLAIRSTVGMDHRSAATRSGAGKPPAPGASSCQAQPADEGPAS